MIRRLLLLLVVVAAQLPALTAVASHYPNEFCSESGDVCTDTHKVDGVRKLRIGTAAKYFSHYKLCVTAPDDSRECKRFEIHKSGAGYGDTVNWAKQFPNKGEGAYTVRWKAQGNYITPKLGFHVKTY